MELIVPLPHGKRTAMTLKMPLVMLSITMATAGLVGTLASLLLLIISDVHWVIAPRWLPRSVAIMSSEKVSTLLLLIAFLMLLISIACSTIALST